MAQQINLLDPILLTQKRQFSAVQMVRALAVFLVLASGFVFWLNSNAEMLRKQTQQRAEQYAKEKAQLNEAVNAVATPVQTEALEKEIAEAKTALDRQIGLRDILAKGKVRAGHSNAALLRVLAATAPPSVWLTDIQSSDERTEIAGYTRDPAAIKDWLEALNANPYFDAQPVTAVHVEKQAEQPKANEPGDPAKAVKSPTAGAYRFALAAIRSAPGGSKPVGGTIPNQARSGAAG